MRLQDFSFNKSQYERPSQKKVCGWSIYGKPCQIGPDAKGNCQAQYECVPYKEGDRWLCTRSSNAGGKCENGPSATGECCNKTPRCVPVSSMRVRRGRLIAGSILFSVLLLVFILASPLHSYFINPGDLSSKHHVDNINCQDCHISDGEKTMKWFAAAWLPVDTRKQNARCGNCHQSGLNGDMAHGLSPQQWKQLTANVPPGNHVLACAACHQEHKGTDYNLLSISDKQCDSCHQHSSIRFEDQHKAFDQYPFSRRSRLVFDHSAHIKDYFTKEKLAALAPKECASCHQLDQAGAYMQVKGFESSCVACHSKDVTGEKLDEKGIAVLSLPALDLDSLSENKIHIGSWPADLEDEELSPLMILLLSSEADLQAVLNSIASGQLELFNLGEQDISVLRQVQKLAIAIKRLLYEISTQGQSALLSRFQKAFGKAIDNRQGAALVSRLPGDLTVNIIEHWFPSLSREMEIYDSGRLVRTKAIATKSFMAMDMSAEDWVSHGGWYRQDFSLMYRPGVHGDAFMKTLLDLSRVSGNTKNTVLLKAFDYLSYPKRSGQCIKCHSIDELDGNVVINWQASHREKTPHSFNRFSHSAHFSLLNEQGCGSCHQMNDGADIMAGFKGRNPRVFESNWLPIEKNTCVKCHNSRSGLDNCTRCHNYHVNEFKTVLPQTRLLKP